MFWKVLFTFLPKIVIAAIETIMISANMTAYSVAVAPSSLTTNSLIFDQNLFISVPPCHGVCFRKIPSDFPENFGGSSWCIPAKGEIACDFTIKTGACNNL